MLLLEGSLPKRRYIAAHVHDKVGTISFSVIDDRFCEDQWEAYLVIPPPRSPAALLAETRLQDVPNKRCNRTSFAGEQGELQMCPDNHDGKMGDICCFHAVAAEGCRLLIRCRLFKASRLSEKV